MIDVNGIIAAALSDSLQQSVASQQATANRIASLKGQRDAIDLAITEAEAVSAEIALDIQNINGAMAIGFPTSSGVKV